MIPLRQRGPGDAYEINPDMWRGGGRFVGESLVGREGTVNTRDIEGGLISGSEQNQGISHAVRENFGTVVRHC